MSNNVLTAIITCYQLQSKSRKKRTNENQCKLFKIVWKILKRISTIKLDLKNCLFSIIRPTQHWRCWLKIFYWTCKSKKKNFWVKKTFPKVTDYFIVMFYMFYMFLCFIVLFRIWTILNITTLSFFVSK